MGIPIVPSIPECHHIFICMTPQLLNCLEKSIYSRLSRLPGSGTLWNRFWEVPNKRGLEPLHTSHHLFLQNFSWQTSQPSCYIQQTGTPHPFHWSSIGLSFLTSVCSKKVMLSTCVASHLTSIYSPSSLYNNESAVTLESYEHTKTVSPKSVSTIVCNIEWIPWLRLLIPYPSISQQPHQWVFRCSKTTFQKGTYQNTPLRATHWHPMKQPLVVKMAVGQPQWRGRVGLKLANPTPQFPMHKETKGHEKQW